MKDSEIRNIAASHNLSGPPVAKILAGYAASVKDHPNNIPGVEGPSESDHMPPPKPLIEQPDNNNTTVVQTLS
jgi:hypothetical protein